MKEKKYYVALDDFERRVVVNCMNEMRNKLIADGYMISATNIVLDGVCPKCAKKLSKRKTNQKRKVSK